MLQFIELNPKNKAKSCVIWLHGLGADGNDFVDIVPQLGLAEASAARFIFPHAPVRNVTWAGNMNMRAWFNVIKLDRASEDEVGIRASQLLIEELIQAQLNQGIPSHKIVLAGFSQGGAMALQTGLRYKEKLAGIVALSSWLPLATTLNLEKSLANQSTPILMQHGTLDDLIPLAWAEQSRNYLQQLNYQIKFDTYPMQHTVCLEEISAIGAWLKELLS